MRACPQASDLLRISAISTSISTSTSTSTHSVPFNKIMPAGEHMAVQNFITPFMAFQHYDVGLPRGKEAHRAAFCPRIFIDVNRGGGGIGIERGFWPAWATGTCWYLKRGHRLSTARHLSAWHARRFRLRPAGDICQARGWVQGSRRVQPFR